MSFKTRPNLSSSSTSALQHTRTMTATQIHFFLDPNEHWSISCLTFEWLRSHTYITYSGVRWSVERNGATKFVDTSIVEIWPQSSSSGFSEVCLCTTRQPTTSSNREHRPHQPINHPELYNRIAQVTKVQKAYPKGVQQWLPKGNTKPSRPPLNTTNHV